MPRLFVISGGLGAIGTSCAKAILDRGDKVISLDIKNENIPLDNKYAYYDISLRSTEDIKLILTKASQHFGQPIDGWIETSGYFATNDLLDSSYEDYLRIFENNIRSPIQVSSALVPSLIENRKGSIVFISSIFSNMSAKGISAYMIAKSASLSLAKSLALELGPFNIRTNIICPGLIRSKFTEDKIMQIYKNNDNLKSKFKDLPKAFTRTSDVASMAINLLYNTSTNGSVITIDQGYSII